MPISPGTKLGQYEVVEAIGAGGIEFLIHVKLFLGKNSRILA